MFRRKSASITPYSSPDGCIALLFPVNIDVNINTDAIPTDLVTPTTITPKSKIIPLFGILGYIVFFQINQRNENTQDIHIYPIMKIYNTANGYVFCCTVDNNNTQKYYLYKLGHEATGYALIDKI